MTIEKYKIAFANLEEYAPHLVTTDEIRARWFEEELWYETKRVVRPIVLPTYVEVMDRVI